jgi:hypothetical protein
VQPGEPGGDATVEEKCWTMKEESWRGPVLEKWVRKEMMSSHEFRSRCVTNATGWMIWTEIGVGMLGATSVNRLVS